MTTGLRPALRPARREGRRRVMVLHGRARERMIRRERMWQILNGQVSCLERLGPSGIKLANQVQRAQNYVERLYNEARGLESRLWEARPKCDVCRGTGEMVVLVADTDEQRKVRCTECSGTGSG